MKMNKKLIAVLTAGVIGVGGFAQIANAATGNAKAVLAGALSLTETTGLNFGGIVNGLAAAATGTVVVANDGVTPVAFTGALSAADAGATRGIFTVSGDNGLTYAVVLPTSTTITDGASTMTVNTFTESAASGTHTLGVSGDTLYVGATLNVSDPAVNANGTYLGTYTINVNYN